MDHTPAQRGRILLRSCGGEKTYISAAFRDEILSDRQTAKYLKGEGGGNS